MKSSVYSFCVLICVFAQLKLSAQSGNVGIGTSSPDPSSQLEVSSTSRGFLLPRMTAAQKNAISSPADGLLIYQTDGTAGFYYYMGGWQPLASSSGSGANVSLSNLVAPTAINNSLLPGSTIAFDLGSAASSWRDIYYSGDVYFQGNRFISGRGTNYFFGPLAGNNLVTGLYNTATGYAALTTNVGGTWNTANGYEALKNTNNSFSNTGTGFQALFSNTSGAQNTATGVLALSTNTGGSFNTANGVGALRLSTGNYNSALGTSAGENLTNGNGNTFLGAQADANSDLPISNATAIGYNASVTTSNRVEVGNTSVTTIGGYAGWTTFPSDRRFKKNIQENVPGLAFINQLRPVTYTLDVEGIDNVLHPASAQRKQAPAALGEKPAASAEDIKAKQEKAAITYTGFIAQEVEAASKKTGYQFSGVDVPKSNQGFYGLRYAEFVVPLVKAVQELNGRVETLEKENASLKNSSQTNVVVKQQEQIDSQQKQIADLKTLVTEMQKQMDLLKHSASK